MANVIVAIHNALLSGNKNALTEIQQELSVKGVNADTVFGAVVNYTLDKHVDDLHAEIACKNHLCYYNLSSFGTTELVKMFAVVLDVKNIRRTANSFCEFCALELFKGYQFILFTDDGVDNKVFSLHSIISNCMVYQLSMKEVYELLLQLNQSDNQIKQFDGRLYWEII